MSALSTAQKMQLARLFEMASASPGPVIKGGRVLADVFRAELTDVDDVTIGRVLLEVGKFAGRVADPADHRANVLVDQIMCAGLELTRAEWDDPAVTLS